MLIVNCFVYYLYVKEVLSILIQQPTVKKMYKTSWTYSQSAIDNNSKFQNNTVTKNLKCLDTQDSSQDTVDSQARYFYWKIKLRILLMQNTMVVAVKEKM